MEKRTATRIARSTARTSPKGPGTAAQTRVNVISKASKQLTNAITEVAACVDGICAKARAGAAIRDRRCATTEKSLCLSQDSMCARKRRISAMHTNHNEPSDAPVMAQHFRQEQKYIHGASELIIFYAKTMCFGHLLVGPMVCGASWGPPRRNVLPQNVGSSVDRNSAQMFRSQPLSRQGFRFPKST